MPPNKDSGRLTGYLERIVFFMIAMGVTASATFQYKLSQDQMKLHNEAVIARQVQREESLIARQDLERIMEMLERHDGRLVGHDKEIAILHGQIQALDGKYITLEALKRLELLLQAMSPENQNSALIKAIRVELESRGNSNE